jgi:uncharacterized protein
MPAPTTDCLIVERTGSQLVSRLERADGPLTRLFGLMGRAGLPEGSGLWLEPCASIHMMFMRFSIDVAWLDSKGVVLKVSSKLRPWLGIAFCPGARVALELPAEAARDLRPGDRLKPS